MENSNRNHRVLAGVLTAAMVLSSFSMGTAGAFAENGPVAEKSGIELRQAGEPVITVTKAKNTDTTVTAETVIAAIKKANSIADSTTTVALYSKTTSEGTWTAETGAVSVSDDSHFYAYTTKAGAEPESAQTAITIELNNTATVPTGDALNFTSKSTGTVDDLKQAIKNTVSAANSADTVYTAALSSATITLKDTSGSEVTDGAKRNTVASYVVSGVAGYDDLTVSGVTVKVTKAYVFTDATSFTLPHDGTQPNLKTAIAGKVNTANTLKDDAAVTADNITLETGTNTAATAETAVTDIKAYKVAAKGDFEETEATDVTVTKTKAYKTATAVTLASADATVEKLKDNLAGQIAQSTEDEATVKTALKVYKKTEDASEDAYGTEVTTGAVKDGEKYGYTVSGVAGYDAGDETKHDITVTVTTEKKDYVLTDASVKTFKLTGTETLADLKDKIVVAVKAKNDGATLAASDVTLTTAEGDATETTKPADVKGYKIAAVGTYKAGTVTDVTVTVEAKAEATATTTTLAITDKDSIVVTGSTYGDALTLTAAVKKGDAAAVAADGTVQFYEGETKLGDAVAIADGKATATVSTLAAGAHSITAKFVPADATKVKESASTATAVTVAKKALTAAVTADNEKTYDGKATATVKLTLTGVVDKDDVTATAAATLENVNAGDKKAIKSISGVALAGTTAGNYTLADTAVATQTGAEGAKTDITVKVNKADAPVMAAQTEYVKVGTEAVNGTSDLSKLFPVVADAGNTSYAVTATSDTVFTAAIDTDNKTLKYTVAAGAAKDKTLAVSVVVTTQNYTYTPVTLTLTTTDKTIVDVSAFTVAGKTYDGKEIDKPVVKDAKGTEISGTIAYTKDGTAFTGTPKDAGKYTAVFTVSGDEEVGTKTVNFEIAKAIVTVTAPSDGITVGDTYDVSKKAPTITGLIGEDELTTAPVLAVYDAKGVAIEAAKIKDLVAGTYTIGFSTEPATTNANYEVKNVNGKLTVSAKPISPSYPSGPSTPSEPTVAPVQVTATAASSNATVKAALDKIVAGKDDKSVVATFKKTDKKIAISATTLAGQNVYIYKLIGNTLAVVDNKAEAVGKDGTLTMDNPEAAVTKKLARTADDSTVTYVLIPATEKPPVASVSGTVEVAQGNVVLFDVTSGKSTDAGFAAGNDAVSETRLYTAYKDGKASYGAYGHGKEGQTTGIYVNGVKLFDVKVVKAPYKSDTTVNITNKKHGAMYWFEITPDNASATVSYTAGNGAVLSTRSKGKQKNGSYLFGFQITGKTGDKSGVYVQINGQNYCVFNVTVA